MEKFPKHMMATKASHKLGDISREKEAIAEISRFDTDKDCYIGNWVYGFGMINVEFPAETTRELTPAEIAKFSEQGYAINNTSYGKLQILGYDNASKPTLSAADAPTESIDQPEHDSFSL